MLGARSGDARSIKSSLVAQTVKKPLAMQETWVQSLGQEDYSSQYSHLGNPVDRGAWRAPDSPQESELNTTVQLAL